MIEKIIQSLKSTAALIITILLSHHTVLGQSLRWLSDFEMGKAEALMENKLIIADFSSVHCKPCAEMDSVWRTEAFVSALQHFVPLRLDSASQRSLYQQYSITTIPAILILDAFGEELASIKKFGSRTDLLLGILQALPRDMASTYDAKKRLLTAPDSLELKVTIADEYHRKMLPKASNRYYQEVLESYMIGGRNDLIYHIKSRMAVNAHLLGDNTKAKRLLEEYLISNPEGVDVPMQLFYLTKVHLLQKDEMSALKYLQMLREKFPGNPYVDRTEDLFPPPDFVEGITREPVVIKRVNPIYPELAMRAGLEGRVWIKIWIDKQGKPRQIIVVKSDAPIFDEPAIEAAKQHVFTPAYINDQPVSVWVSIPFRFKLADKKSNN